MNVQQTTIDFGGKPTAGAVLNRIRRESRDESEKGRWFEELFVRVALQEPEFEIDAVWRWPEWPEREDVTGRDGRDIGIDLVARRTSGEWVAIQCKCYDERRTLPKSEVDKFLGASQHQQLQLARVSERGRAHLRSAAAGENRRPDGAAPSQPLRRPTESARSMPRRSSRPASQITAKPPYAASTWSQMPWDRQ